MDKFFETVKKVEEVLCVILMVAMCLVVFAATVARYTGWFTISWSEEFARYCMIWVVFLGIGVAAVNGEHFAVEALSLFCPKKILNVIKVICAVLVVAFNLFAAYFGVVILEFQIAGGELTPSLYWPMWLIYLSIPLGLVIMAAGYCYNTYKQIKGKEKAKTLEEEETAE